MPATAGKVRMPANNRMQTSASLNTHSIWQNAIGYDPYAADNSGADTAVKAEAAASAHENMKALLALARTNKVGKDEDEKGGWRGSAKLRGGWVTKDLGEVPKEEPVANKAAGKGARAGNSAIDDMPSSTSSWSSDEEDGFGGGPSSAAAAARSAERERKRTREEDEDGERKKKKKHKDGKKEKHKSSKHKKEKHKKEKQKKERHKSDKSDKKKRRDSDD